MGWQALRLKIACGLLLGCLLVNSYGVVALLLFTANRSLLLGYMGLAVLTVPAFVLVHFLAPARVRRKRKSDAKGLEHLFIRLYEGNLRMAGGIWLLIFLIGILREKL